MPNHQDLFNQGNIYFRAEQYDKAIDCYRGAIELKADYWPAYYALALLYVDLVKLNEAAELINQALKLAPQSALAYCILSDIERRRGNLEAARIDLERAIESKVEPALAALYSGRLLKAEGQIKEASRQVAKAIKLKPGLDDAYFDRAVIWLIQGDYVRGWPEYEARFRTKKTKQPPLPLPRWDGRSFKQQVLLVYTEQGFGDVIQFVRYLPLVKERGGQVVFACHKELVRLLKNCPGYDRIIELAQVVPMADDCQWQVPLMSLPSIFKTTLTTIPDKFPYVWVNQSMIDEWRERLKPDRSLKVGLVWAGSPRHMNDWNRSCALADFAPLADIPGVKYFSLQKGERAAEIKKPPAGMEIVDLSAELADFAETAAVIANLDLTISVDTAVVHLAGAMNKPIWLLLPFDPEWRWLLGRSDSPWYPTLKIFRQKNSRLWSEVIREVKDNLSRLKARTGANR